MGFKSGLRAGVFGWVAVLLLSASPLAVAHEDGYVHPPEEPVMEKEEASWGHRVLWYVPNRCLDLSDMLRLRFRYGRGWAGNLRLGEPGAMFGGDYKAHFAGFPGPRYPERLRKYYGPEELKGLQLSLVDATDENPHEPNYTFSEFVIGAQLEYIGLDVGTDPFEWLDFFGGLFFWDPRGDDL